MFKRLIDILALGLAAPLVWLMAYLPRPYAMHIARGCVWLLFLCMPRLRGVGERNLELIFPEKPLEERRRILDASIDVLADNLLGYCRGPRLTKETARELSDYSAVAQTFESLKQQNGETGVLIVMLHFGVFELFLHIHALLYRPVAVLARGFGLPLLDSWWNSRRETFGNEVFGRKGGYQEIVRRLRVKQDVCLLFDQNVKRNHAVFASFFGIQAATTKAVALAALRTGAPVIVAACARLNGGSRYSPFVYAVGTCSQGDRARDEAVQEFTERLHRASEEIIRAHPEQWFWVHRRYKTRPPGEPENLYK